MCHMLEMLRHRRVESSGGGRVVHVLGGVSGCVWRRVHHDLHVGLVAGVEEERVSSKLQLPGHLAPGTTVAVSGDAAVVKHRALLV